MDAIGIFAIVKVIETVVGICLVLNLFVPVAAMLEMPVSFIIFYLSVFIAPDSRAIWTGPKEVICNVLVLAAYWGYFTPLLRPVVKWRPLWKAGKQMS